MRIAICDDEQSQLEYVRALVQAWGTQTGTPIELTLFKSAEEFWFAYEKNVFDIVLLDIQMNGQNGMDLARELRQKQDRVDIIFLTGFADFLPDGYEVEAVRYLLKPVEKEKLFVALSAVLEKHKEKQERKILFPFGAESIAVYENEILYAEAFSHSTKLVTKEKAIELPMGIGDVEVMLSVNNFLKVHRSYLVNLGAIGQIRKYELTLDNGDVLPVSRRLFAEVHRAFISYYKKEAETK